MTPCACPGVCKKPSYCCQYGPGFEEAWLKQHGLYARTAQGRFVAQGQQKKREAPVNTG